MIKYVTQPNVDSVLRRQLEANPSQRKYAVLDKLNGHSVIDLEDYSPKKTIRDSIGNIKCIPCFLAKNTTRFLVVSSKYYIPLILADDAEYGDYGEVRPGGRTVIFTGERFNLEFVDDSIIECWQCK